MPHEGPLGGVLSALFETNTEYNFAVACDMPFLNAEIITYMVKAVAENEVVVPQWKEKLHPLCALYTKSSLPIAERLFSQGKRAMKDLLQALTVKIVDESELKAIDPHGLMFTNINTVNEYESYTKKNA